MAGDDAILEMGALCEVLLSHAGFTKIIGDYELTIAADLLATAPHEQKKRENLYATLWGARGLVSYMKLNVDAAAKIKSEYNETPVTMDETAFAYAPDEPRDDFDEENDY